MGNTFVTDRVPIAVPRASLLIGNKAVYLLELRPTVEMSYLRVDAPWTSRGGETYCS